MKNTLKISLFAMGIAFSTGAMAATGTGHAQAQLTHPLTVENTRDVNFGTIAIDPAAGTQTASIAAGLGGTLTCPATYVCSGGISDGGIRVTGAADVSVSIDITGSTATLDDGSGNTLIFDPYFSPGNDLLASVTISNINNQANVSVGGEITFTGNETAGTYTSQNGSGYQVTVNY